MSESIAEVEYGGRQATFGNQNIECSASGPRIHDLQTDTAPRERKRQLSRCKAVLPATAQDHHFG